MFARRNTSPVGYINIGFFKRANAVRPYKGNSMNLIDIGYGNSLNEDRIVAVVSAEAAPTRRMVSAAKEKNLAVDATCGKKTKTVYIMDSGHIVLSAKAAEIGKNGLQEKA